MPENTETKPTEEVKPEEQPKPKEKSGLVMRVEALEEKVAKFRTLEKRIEENSAAISRVRNCIGAVHK